MAKGIYANVQKKVIPFEQNAEFFHRKARKYVENNNYINALDFYRKAVEKEPHNVEYLLDLAEVFTEMGYYIESNKILFSVLPKNKELTDCFFGIGCNFLGMQEFEKAATFFEKYLDENEDGIYFEEALDLLDVLKNQEYYMEQYEEKSPARDRIYKLAQRGKELLDRGQYEKAVQELEKVIKAEPELLFARNNLALAYFCSGDLEKAIEQSREAALISPSNIHAKCNLALFMHEKGDLSISRMYIDSIIKVDTDDPEEVHKIAVTLCELKLHKEANEKLKILLRYKPYDTKVLHFMGISCYNLGKYKTALSYLDKIEKITPNDTVVNYYKKFIKDCISGREKFKELPYSFQVPYDEVINRVNKINDMLMLTKEALKEKWKNGNVLYSLLSWGLDLNDDVIKSAILNVVASFNDEKAEKFLRDFIFRKNENDFLVKEAVTLLRQMNASEPYIAYMGNDIVEVKIRVTDFDNYKVPAIYSLLERISQYAIDNMVNRYAEGFEVEIKDLWEKIIAKVDYGDILCKKVEGWAAALELYYCIKKGFKVKRNTLADLYSISYSTMMRNYKMIFEAMGEGDLYN